MQPRFSPQRQGARYRLDESDLVILGGTPEWSRDSGLRDTRIRINCNGYAERAVWVHAAARVDEPGLKAEFHSWVHQLDGPSVARINDALLALGQALQATTAERDPGIRVRVLRFRLNGNLADLSVASPAEDTLSREQRSAFDAAWALIDATVPAGA
jgi:hypothetical protein